MRGKDVLVWRFAGACGITPAYAGKSMLVALALPVSRDHPRVCGEKVRSRVLMGLSLGSPPRMRGKGINSMTAGTLEGITPAYAGKSTRHKCG